jgi:hypothetical protein
MEVSNSYHRLVFPADNADLRRNIICDYQRNQREKFFQNEVNTP